MNGVALPNNKMQLTSGGLNGALRAPSSMRRFQLILVLCGPPSAAATPRTEGTKRDRPRDA